MLGTDPAAFRERLTRTQSHAQARADRSDDPERHRQRLLRRDPASRPPLAADADAVISTTPSGNACTTRRKRRSTDWIERLRADAAGEFPEKVTAFREGMAVHGRYGKPCPVCGTAIQRIRYAENETNYCPRCQTGGKLLADRSLSRLLKDDWPKTIEALENQRKQRDRIEPDACTAPATALHRRSIASSSGCGTGKARRSRTCEGSADAGRRLRPGHQSRRGRDPQLQRRGRR